MAGGIISLPQTVQQEEKNNLVLTMMTLIIIIKRECTVKRTQTHFHISAITVLISSGRLLLPESMSMIDIILEST